MKRTVPASSSRRDARIFAAPGEAHGGVDGHAEGGVGALRVERNRGIHGEFLEEDALEGALGRGLGDLGGGVERIEAVGPAGGDVGGEFPVPRVEQVQHHEAGEEVRGGLEEASAVGVDAARAGLRVQNGGLRFGDGEAAGRAVEVGDALQARELILRVAELDRDAAGERTRRVELAVREEAQHGHRAADEADAPPDGVQLLHDGVRLGRLFDLGDIAVLV